MIVSSVSNIGGRKTAVVGIEPDLALFKNVYDELCAVRSDLPGLSLVAVTDCRLVSNENGFEFITALDGKKTEFFVFVAAPLDELEIKLAAAQGLAGNALTITGRLLAMGFMNGDFRHADERLCFSLFCAFKKLGLDFKKSGEERNRVKADKITASALLPYKNSHKGERCFVLGCGCCGSLDKINLLMNERTFSCDGICECFSRTAQRPSYYLLTEQEVYDKGGKYIEGLEAFVSNSVKISAEKFKKKPVVFNEKSGFASGLIGFEPLFESGSLSPIRSLCYMIELAAFMGFDEIYTYGFSNLYDICYTEYDEIIPTEGKTEFPVEAQTFLQDIAESAETLGSTVYSLDDDITAFKKADFAAVFSANSETLNQY